MKNGMVQNPLKAREILWRHQNSMDSVLSSYESCIGMGSADGAEMRGAIKAMKFITKYLEKIKQDVDAE